MHCTVCTYQLLLQMWLPPIGDTVDIFSYLEDIQRALEYIL